jgi:hypothetical protein
MAATVEKLADAIVAMAQLSPDERESVMRVVAQLACQTIATSETEVESEKRPRREQYEPHEIKRLTDYIKDEASYTSKERRNIKQTLAAELGRSRKAIDVRLSRLRKASQSKG